MTTSKTVLVPIADGSEEIETTCITDTLTRFGADVTVASVGPSLECRMSRGIKVVADCPIADCATKNWDLIALPGGMPGAEHLRDSDVLVDLIKKQKAAGKLYAAICACAWSSWTFVSCCCCSSSSMPLTISCALSLSHTHTLTSLTCVHASIN
jgi:putative intracellular protease/amidase